MGFAYVVLFITLACTFVVFFRVQENVKARDQARFDLATSQIQSAVERRLARCVDQMYAVRALFAADENVSPAEWKAFFAAMNVRQSNLGVRTLGYLEKVTPATKADFLKEWNPGDRIRRTILPPGDRPVYYPAVYTTHFDWSADVYFGLDHGNQPERLAAINQAIDGNNPAVTGRIRMITTSGTSTNSGTFFYLPVYKSGASIASVEARREAAQGVVYMTVFPQKMLALLLEEEANLGVDVDIFDGPEANPGKLFYEGDTASPTNNLISRLKSHPTLARQMVVPVFNQEWTLAFSTTPQFDAASQRYLQWVALAIGLAVSLLFFGIAWVQANARARAEADEAALAIEKEELAVTLFSIGDGVITTDGAAKIVSLNKAAQFLTGWSQAEAKGKPLAEVFRLIHEENRKTAADPVEGVLTTGKVVELGNHILLVARDGTERAIADSAAPIRGKDGKVTGTVLVFRDVTEKRKIEAQMFKESKLESVGLLAGGIAHDFNNMLAAIVGNLSLTRLPGMSHEEQMNLMAEAEKGAMRARDLTQQLLTFARGGAPIKKTTRLNTLVREACEFAVRGSNVQCQYSLKDDAWPAEIDEGQFRQVLNNLVINARQAMPDGGKVEVSLENVELAAGVLPPLPAGKHVKVSIKDNGAGIKPELLPRIFEPYFTTKKGGNGLGLATAYSVVRKHDGIIKVDSAPGAGSVFQIFLPASGKPVPSLPSESPRGKLAGNGRLLIMDDEDAMLKVLGAMLRKFGYEVETALDGAEAIECYAAAKAAGKPFKAVIMDLTIPNGMGGREAVKRLLELDPNLKAIVSSGYSLDPVMANYCEYGFRGVIPKPYRVEDLSRVLQEVLNN
ncbi:MAG TPA: CHASE domain-containing protein [Candidatus Aquilonibacter sp.]|nr:CHASE domain-containing protein [Candidatus Aquilonibacter sp.]